ncbi:MAG: hypothetical protein M3346_04050 [Actinomycetota bacterium]|nr:hypothetical protein [Actinomycetota bacterium]
MGHYWAVKSRTASRLAWVAFGFVTFVYLAGLAFSLLNRSTDHPGVSTFDPIVVALFAFPVVGVLVASRQPWNPTGWILLAIGLAWGLYSLLNGYSLYGLVTQPGALPRPDLSVALSSWLWIPAVGLMGTFLILLFPDGRLPSPRSRPLARLSGITMVVASVEVVVAPGSFADEGFPSVTNPLGINALRPIIGVVDPISIALLLLCIVGSTIALIRRFRRSHGQEHLQLKWLAAAAGVVAFAYLAMMVVGGFFYYSGSQSRPLWSNILEQVAVCSFVLVPLAMGVAILRHRLYDIDLLINRTLVYGALTILLSLVYVGGVVGAGNLLRSVTGQTNNNLAVAASTLAVAALFRPALARIQSFIDRLFYRRKYDAAQTLEAFSERLREQVELDSLTSDLLATVGSTMQPTHTSLWIKPPYMK